jgi:hypothetical protein
MSPFRPSRPDHTAVRQIGSPFSSPFSLQLTVNVLMTPSDHQGLIKLLSSRLELQSAHHSACYFPLGSPFGSPEGVGEMAPAGWMKAHPYPLPPFFPPSSLHLSHTIITCQAFTVKSSRTAAAWSSTTKSRRSSSRNTSPATDKHAQPSAFILPPSLFPSILPTSLSP